MSVKTMEEMLRGCRRLNSLSLRCGEFALFSGLTTSDSLMLAIAINTGSRLLKLSIRYAEVSPQGLSYIRDHCSYLTSLRLSTDSEDALAIIETFPLLRRVRFQKSATRYMVSYPTFIFFFCSKGKGGTVKYLYLSSPPPLFSLE